MKVKNEKVLNWIKREKFLLQSLINHHQANVFALIHFASYSVSLKDWWDLWKIKRYIKKLNDLDAKLREKK